MTRARGPIVVSSGQGPEADEAIRQGWDLSRRTGGPFHVCHVFPERIALEPLLAQEPLAGSFRISDLEDEARVELAGRVAALTGASEADITVGCEQASAHGGLLRYAEKVGAALLVLGANGTPRAQAMALDVTARVVRHAPCSVLLARPPRPGPVLAATDLSAAASAALAGAADEARRRERSLVAVHVIDYLPRGRGARGGPAGETWARVRAAAARRLEADLAARAPEGAPVLRRGRAGEQIGALCEELQADLLVVGTHGRTALPRLALGSVAELVLRRARGSVLFVRPELRGDR
jgi:nucleotide-binding universal stress UspA family protein